MQLADLELEAIRANDKLTFHKLNSIISDYYQIALMRREIHLLRMRREIHLLRVSRQAQSALEHE